MAQNQNSYFIWENIFETYTPDNEPKEAGPLKLLLNRFLLRTTIVPEAWYRLFDIQYQTYLYYIFHLTAPAQITHSICKPLGFMTLMCYFHQFKLLGIDVASLFAYGCFGFYVVQCIYAKLYTLSLFLVPFILGLIHFGELLCYLTEGLSPIVLALMVIIPPLCDSLSHGAEVVPPYASGTDEWLLWKDVDLIPRILTIMLLPFYITAELVATPKLIPIQLAIYMINFDMLPELKKKVDPEVKAGLASPSRQRTNSNPPIHLLPSKIDQLRVTRARSYTVGERTSRKNVSRKLELMSEFAEESFPYVAKRRNSTLH